jgi:hypothetical protein
MDNFAIFGINKNGVIILNRICERKRANRVNGFPIKATYKINNQVIPKLAHEVK